MALYIFRIIIIIIIVIIIIIIIIIIMYVYSSRIFLCSFDKYCFCYGVRISIIALTARFYEAH